MVQGTCVTPPVRVKAISETPCFVAVAAVPAVFFVVVAGAASMGALRFVLSVARGSRSLRSAAEVGLPTPRDIASPAP